MRKLFLLLMAAVMGVCGTLRAQNADRIVGTYKALQDGVHSKVKVFKHDGGYRFQVCWVDNLKMPDGSLRLDPNNPDPKKRGVRADQIVVVDKVTYNADKDRWDGGKIYDPTSGRVYRVEFTLKEGKKLQVKGFLGPLHKSVYWTKAE